MTAPRLLPRYSDSTATVEESGVRARGDSEPPPTLRSAHGRPVAGRPAPAPVAAPRAEEVPLSLRSLRPLPESARALPVPSPALSNDRLFRLGHAAKAALGPDDPLRRLIEIALLRRDAALLGGVLRTLHESGARAARERQG